LLNPKYEHLQFISEIDTNRELLVISVLLILFGVGSGLPILFILGFFLLFPALLLSSKPIPPKPPIGASQQPPKRSSPPSPKLLQAQAQTPAMESGPTPLAASYASYASVQTPQISYSPSLFPSNIFPSILQATTPMSSGAPQSGEVSQVTMRERETREPREDLLEIGAILLLVKLVSG